VGFYNTFTALPGPVRAGVEVAGGREVAAVRGEGFAGVQFHPESILTTDGVAIARRLLTALL
jgi:phenazine biosynthesis protein phzE